jgi:hypothetical protein
VAVNEHDPMRWRLDVAQSSIDLYLALLEGEPRELSREECTQLLDLIEAWRLHEGRKHRALMAALEELPPQVAHRILAERVDDDRPPV